MTNAALGAPWGRSGTIRGVLGSAPGRILEQQTMGEWTSFLSSRSGLAAWLKDGDCRRGLAGFADSWRWPASALILCMHFFPYFSSDVCKVVIVVCLVLSDDVRVRD